MNTQESNKDTHIWQMVKTIEEQFSTHANINHECRSTMLVNFGPNAKVYPNVVRESDTLNQMIIYGFSHLYDLVNDNKSALKEAVQWIKCLKQLIPDNNPELKGAIDNFINTHNKK